jgi:gluconokinase
MTALIVCGVAGAGKSTVAAGVARALGWELVEGDDFHTRSSIERMRRGLPLTDSDRAPWLAAIRDAVMARLDDGSRVVVACSALTRDHRSALRMPGCDIRFLQLPLPPASALARLQERSGHFAGPVLAASQHATLEPLGPDEPGIAIDGTMPLDRLIAIATAYAIAGAASVTESQAR